MTVTAKNYARIMAENGPNGSSCGQEHSFELFIPGVSQVRVPSSLPQEVSLRSFFFHVQSLYTVGFWAFWFNLIFGYVESHYPLEM